MNRVLKMCLQTCEIIQTRQTFLLCSYNYIDKELVKIIKYISE